MPSVGHGRAGFVQMTRMGWWAEMMPKTAVKSYNCARFLAYDSVR